MDLDRINAELHAAVDADLGVEEVPTANATFLAAGRFVREGMASGAISMSRVLIYLADPTLAVIDAIDHYLESQDRCHTCPNQPDCASVAVWNSLPKDVQEEAQQSEHTMQKLLKRMSNSDRN